MKLNEVDWKTFCSTPQTKLVFYLVVFYTLKLFPLRAEELGETTTTLAWTTTSSKMRTAEEPARETATAETEVCEKNQTFS